MDKLTIEVIHDSDRDINSWVFYGHDDLVVVKDILVDAHLDIHDIFLSPTSSLILFPINKRLRYGRIYKGMYLVHPSAVTKDILPVFCVNERFLEVRYPNKDDNFFLNRAAYVTMLSDNSLMMKHYYDHNLHLIGVYDEAITDIFGTEWSGDEPK